MTGASRSRSGPAFEIVDPAPGPDGKHSSGLPSYKAFTASGNLWLRHFVARNRGDLKGGLTIVTTDIMGATATRLESKKLLKLADGVEAARPVAIVNKALWQANTAVLHPLNVAAFHQIGKAEGKLPDKASFQMSGDGFINTIVDSQWPAGSYAEHLSAIKERFADLLPSMLEAEYGSASACLLLEKGPLRNIGIRWGSASVSIADLMAAPPSGRNEEEFAADKLSFLASGIRFSRLLTMRSDVACNLGPALVDPFGVPESVVEVTTSRHLGDFAVSTRAATYALSGDIVECLRGSESALAAGITTDMGSRLDGSHLWRS